MPKAEPTAAAVVTLDDIALADAVHRVVAQVRPALHGAQALDATEADSTLLLVDLGRRRDRVQGSALARLFSVEASDLVDGPPAATTDADRAALAQALEALRSADRLLAVHDRGAGGLLACVAGMALAGKVGAALNLDLLLTEGGGLSDGRMDSGEVKNWTQQVSGRRAEQTLRALFAEEAGCVLQVPTAARSEVMASLRVHDLSRHTYFIGKTRPDLAPGDAGKGELTIWRDATRIFGCPLADLGCAEAPADKSP